MKKKITTKRMKTKKNKGLLCLLLTEFTRRISTWSRGDGLNLLQKCLPSKKRQLLRPSGYVSD